MMILDIFDMSALVHTGNTAEAYRYDSYYNYPTGGIHYALKYIVPSLLTGHYVIAAFDSRSFRKDIVCDYKAGRTFNKVVKSQLETLYEGLLSANIACYKYDTFEADDIINWAVKEYKARDDVQEVVIFGNDYDLCHNVDFRVRFRGINSNVNSIYYGNFSKSIRMGDTVMFNTIAAYKVFCGDTSDSIPSFKHSGGLTGRQIYGRYVKFISDAQEEASVVFSIDYLTSINPLGVFINKSGLFNDDDKKDLGIRIKLIYPADRPADVELLASNRDSLDRDNLYRFLLVYGDRYSLSSFNMYRATPCKEDIEVVKEKARQLLSGEYEVDRSLPLETNYSVYEDDEALFLREF